MRGKDGIYCRYIKRALDLLLAVLLCIPAIPIVAICFVGIKLETRGPAFFLQERPGKNGKIFLLYKLRTMIEQTEKDDVVLSDMDRVTKIGRVIRACSFDELPQIWNVLKGDMSFIGPRPLLEKYLSLYTEEQMHRHDVLPGISGWAQVNGRNELSWDQKFERDLYYVHNVSFALDVKILAMTIVNVFKRSGINAGVNETMMEFRGSTETADDSEREVVI